SQGPPLILTPAVHSRTSVKSYPQPIQLRIRQSARRPARSLGDQRGFAASPPPSPPLVHRLRRDPQPVCHLGRRHALLEHLRGLQPHHLPTDPSPRGQNTLTVFYGDSGGGEDFDWRVEWAHIAPIGVHRRLTGVARRRRFAWAAASLLLVSAAVGTAARGGVHR